MAIDFSLINGGGGLPDFTSNVMKQIEADKQREQQMAIAQQQIAAQGPNSIDFARDARAAQMDAVKLAREQQAMGLDLNQDAREERKTIGYENLTNKNIEKIGSDMDLDWNKFAVDTDIKYKDYGLRKGDQEFSHGLQKEKFNFDKEVTLKDLGKKIEWGDNADNREERKFGFEIAKHREKLAQEEDQRQTIRNAISQGSQAVLEEFTAQGTPEKGTQFVNGLSAISKQVEDEKNTKARDIAKSVFTQFGYDIMKGKGVPTYVTNSALELAGVDPKTLTEDQYNNAGRVAVLTMVKPNMEQVFSGNPAAMNDVMAKAYGIKNTPKLSDSAMNNRYEYISKSNAQAQNTHIVLESLEKYKELLRQFPQLGGAAPEDVLSAGGDIAAGVSNTLRNMGVPIGNSGNAADDAIESMRSFQTTIAKSYTDNLGDGTEKGNARAMNSVLGSLNAGEAGIESFIEGAGLRTRILNNAVESSVAEYFPEAPVEVIQRASSKLTKQLGQINAARKKKGLPKLNDQQVEEYLNTSLQEWE